MTSLPKPVRRHPVLVAIAGALSLGLSGFVAGRAVQQVRSDQMAPWILGRASGIAAYLLLVALVLVGLLLAHPSRAITGGSSPGRIRVHITLALFTLCFTALHVVVLATDRYAGVGWAGAALPLGASYRPVAVTLGLLGLWTGLLAGSSAALAGHLPRRWWWPVHKAAASTLALVWVHGVLAGSDSPTLLWLYVGSGLLVLGAAVWRYVARRTLQPAPARSRR
ncbi:MAG TPA: hypothetical protein VFH38_13350 [Jatrophihabitans sp.]|nr:hypothetical protein [Jatrophihabitans sp.]